MVCRREVYQGGIPGPGSTSWVHRRAPHPLVCLLVLRVLRGVLGGEALGSGPFYSLGKLPGENHPAQSGHPSSRNPTREDRRRKTDSG